MNLGLRPLSRVNYQIGQAERLNLGVPGDTFDISTIYQGDGGSYEAYLGTGVAITRRSYSRRELWLSFWQQGLQHQKSHPGYTGLLL